MVRMHTEFLQSQIQALSEQVTDLSDTVNKLAMKPLENPGTS